MENNNEIPLLQIKMVTPVIKSKLVHRSHLINKIEKGIEHGFVLVSSPPGYGKTTLVADWAHHSKTPVAWLSLDAYDNDLLIFNRYIKQLLDKTFFSFNPSQFNLLVESNSIDDYPTLLATFINSFSESTTDYTLVLDDYHLIKNQKIHESIIYLLDHFPAHLRLIIITRSDPPFSLARLRANHRITELHAAELAFSLQETNQFLNQIRQLSLPDQTVAQFYEKTEGWVTGLQLASLTNIDAKLMEKHDLTISYNTNLTMEYIVEEVVKQQPIKIQKFLLRTSVLTNLYGPLCDYILEPFEPASNSRELLNELFHSNLFLNTLDPEENWYRYHPLFVTALRQILEENYREEITILYSRAISWCEQHDLYDAALTYAETIGDKSRMVELLEKYSFEAIKQNRIMDVIGQVNRTDQELIASSPVLSLVYSWRYLLSFDIDTGEIWLDKASKLMETLDPDSRLKPFENEIWGLLAAGKSIIAATQYDMNKALELSRQTLRLLPEENDFAHSFALLNQGIMLSINGKLIKAIRVLRETINNGEISGNWFAMMIARINLGEILIDNGQLDQAMILFQQSIKFSSTTPGKYSTFESFYLKEISDIYLAKNQLDEAQQYLQKSVEKSGNTLPTFTEFDTHIRMAHLFHCQGNFLQSKSELTLARQLSITSQARLDDMILDLYEVKWALQRGQISSAQKLMQKLGLDEKTSLRELRSIPFTMADNALIIIARSLLTQGRLQNDPEKLNLAIEKLNELVPLLIDAGMVEHLIEVYILLSLAYHELNKNDEMLTMVHTALKTAEPEEFRQLFLDEGIPMSQILIHYLAALKQKKFRDNLPSKSFVTDLLFRLTNREIDLKEDEKEFEPGPEDDVLIVELLTARENEILQLVGKGCSNQEIALELHISVNTVKRHLNNAFMKLGASTRTQAIRVAHQQGFIK
ncbi:MAG: tetratricopeptide repeat protein [Thermotogaceae bacterium]|nr:tetratricopeptide repeat protein [Thermotogaceae bacterium]